MGLSPIFEFADQLVNENAALDPCLATDDGIEGFDDRLTDYSPSGHEARLDHTRRALAGLADLASTSDDDRLAKDFITERLETSLPRRRDGRMAARPQRRLRAVEHRAQRFRSDAPHR